MLLAVTVRPNGGPRLHSRPTTWELPYPAKDELIYADPLPPLLPGCPDCYPQPVLSTARCFLTHMLASSCS